MKKKGNYTEMYKTTSGQLDNQTKAALLEYLTESDEFHKLVCDITGTERKQVKVSPELEKIKEDYLHVCNRYKQEQQKSNDLLHKWREETARRMDAERERDNAEKRHKYLIDEIFSMLKEVKCSSVRGIVDSLKAERANGKLLAEENEMYRRENDKLKTSYDTVCKEAKTIESKRKNLSANYDHLVESYQFLNKSVRNKEETVRKLYEENKRLTDKVEKLKGKLDRASKRYGELTKIICDKAIKSI